MTGSRRVSARDIAQAGSLKDLIDHLIEDVRGGSMELKERAAMFLDNLCKQPMGLEADQVVDNNVLIARAGAIKPLVALVVIGTPIAQFHACGALSVIAHESKEYQEQMFDFGAVLPLSSALRTGDPGVQEQAAAAIAQVRPYRCRRPRARMHDTTIMRPDPHRTPPQPQR